MINGSPIRFTMMVELKFEKLQFSPSCSNTWNTICKSLHSMNVYQGSTFFSILKKIVKLGCRHSSVDLYAPTILPPRVLVPSTQSMLIFIYSIVPYLSCEKSKNKQKRSGLAHFLKTLRFFVVRRKIYCFQLSSFWHTS